MVHINNLELLMIEAKKKGCIYFPSTQETRELMRIISICKGFVQEESRDLLVPVSFADLLFEKLDDLELFLSYDLYREAMNYFLQASSRGELALTRFTVNSPHSSIETLQREFRLKPICAIAGINYATIKHFVDAYNGSNTSFFPSRNEMRKDAMRKGNRVAISFFNDVPQLEFPRLGANSLYPPLVKYQN